MENYESLLRVQLLKYVTTFHSEKWYLMVGCLGGLGRSLSKWMLSRGANKFVFLGRSGIDKPAARRFVEDLGKQGATCVVIRGDVCSIADAEKLVKAAKGPIGGVVQAAMGLDVSFHIILQWKTLLTNS